MEAAGGVVNTNGTVRRVYIELAINKRENSSEVMSQCTVWEGIIYIQE